MPLANYPVTLTGVVRCIPQAVPTSLLVVSQTDSLLDQVVVSNTTAGALTVTVSDRQGSPIPILSAVSVVANSTYVIDFPKGYLCPHGFTVVASGSGLNFAAEWRQ